MAASAAYAGDADPYVKPRDEDDDEGDDDDLDDDAPEAGDDGLVEPDGSTR